MIRVTVLDQATGANHSFDIDATDTIRQLKVKLASRTGVPAASQVLRFQDKNLEDYSNFRQNSISTGSSLTLVRAAAQPQPQARPQQQAGFGYQQTPQYGGFNPMQNQQSYEAMFRTKYQQEAVKLRSHYAANPSELNMLLERDPVLAEAILNDDINVTIQMIAERHTEAKKKQMEEIMEEQRLEADPFNPEYQKKIEERIKKKRLDDQ